MTRPTQQHWLLILNHRVIENLTRCYDFYMVYERSPLICAEKTERVMQYIGRYKRLMQNKGVKFDGTPEDRELFKRLEQEIGREYATRTKVRPIPRWGICGNPTKKHVELCVDKALVEQAKTVFKSKGYLLLIDYLENILEQGLRSELKS